MRRAAMGAAAIVALAPCAIAQDTCEEPGGPAPSCTGPPTPGQFLAELINQRGYDRTQRPGCGDRSPTVVEVQFYLTQLNEINQKSGVLRLSGYFRTWWKDPRLAFNSTGDGGCFDSVVLMGADGEQLWRPDVHFHSAVSMVVDGFASLVDISPDGTVWQSQQTTVSVHSALQLGPLPYDSHVGRATVTSFSNSISTVRVKPRRGVVGPGISGVGLSAAPMTSTVWKFPEGAESGFTTPGEVTVRGGRDFLTLSFQFSRKPKYFVDQVIVPSVLVLFVSYMQFWVDPNVAPARAFLAVVPVLIMRTLDNSVYQSLPEGSQQMWLADQLSMFTYVAILGALQFGVVQHCRNVEAGRAAKREGLKRVEAKARMMIASAHEAGLTLLDFMNKCEAVEMVPGEAQPSSSDPDMGAAPSSPRGRKLVASPEAVSQNVKESDMLFVRYSLKIFELYDTNLSKALNAKEVRSAFTDFDIYLSTSQTPVVMCMYLRDCGLTTPVNEAEVEVKFSDFCGLLIDIEKYMLKHRHSSLKEFLEGSPPTKRCDIFARVLMPTIVALQLGLFYACLPLYG